MKATWLRLESRIDTLSLRERALAFLVAALVLVTILNTLLIDPLLTEQKVMSQSIRQSQQQIAAMQAEIQNLVRIHTEDPDAPVRARLDALKRQSAALHQELQSIQQDLVAPEKMASMLEDILRRNGRLQLTALKTLPATPLNDAAQLEPATVSQANKPEPAGKPTKDKGLEGIYQHGVEFVVQGTYADIMQYLGQLEAMPWRLFWESAMLSSEAYPVLRLKLTVFTLSLDENWLNL